MHEQILRAVQANTEVSTALLRWLQSQTVSKTDLQNFELRITALIEDSHDQCNRVILAPLLAQGASLVRKFRALDAKSSPANPQ